MKSVTKSTRTIAAELTKKKHPISHTKVAQFLHKQNYSLQGNRKTEEGADHEDRDAQFRHINTSVKKALASDLPVISVDTKKKEILGNYQNGGQDGALQSNPVRFKGMIFRDLTCRVRIHTGSMILVKTRGSSMWEPS